MANIIFILNSNNKGYDTIARILANFSIQILNYLKIQTLEKIERTLKPIENETDILTIEEYQISLLKIINNTNYKENKFHHLKSKLLKKIIELPDLNSLKNSPNFKSKEYTFKESKNGGYLYDIEMDFDFSLYIFLYFYEKNKEEMQNKLKTKHFSKHFVDTSTKVINNIYWGVAKVIRDTLAHDGIIDDDSGSGVFKILKTEEVDFFGTKVKISEFEGKRVTEVVNSIDLIFLIYLLGKEIENIK